jgi:hypothetical protein
MDLAELNQIVQNERDRQKSIRIRCCTSGGCQASNSLQVKARMEMAVKGVGARRYRGGAKRWLYGFLRSWSIGGSRSSPDSL